tara:strand:- start:40898 stop:41620 length:723 start_codon:yes stop_codon:yes gene_type:complete
MKISLITTVYNGIDSIEQTIESVIRQNYSNLEYIIVDAASTDGTDKILKKYSKYISHLINEPDKGIYYGINKGIKISSGEIIATLNSGDTLFNNALTTIAKYFREHEDLDFLFGVVEKKKIHYKYEPNKMWWSFNFYPAHSGGFYISKKAQDKIGLYNTKYKCSSDYDLFWKMIRDFKMKGMVTKKNEVIAKFAPGGFSSKLSLFEHMIEETNIRINNKQNKILVMAIFIAKFIKHFTKI